MRRLLVLIAFVTVLLPSAAKSQGPWFFAVLADPQFGMFAKDRNFAQETANFQFAVDNLNRLKPRFVIVCGDLVNRTGDPAEIAEYKRILSKLDPSIPVYNVAGNHDVGNVPTSATLDQYRTAFGPDHYTFSVGGIFGVVLDSNLISAPQSAPEAAKQQDDWLEKTLASARSDPNRQIVVFQHIPYFIHDAGEADQYFNIPRAARRKYLDLLENAGVNYVFAGHFHRNAVSTEGPLTETVTGAVGMPLGGSLSGFRIVTVDGRKLDSAWFCFGGIPNQVDLHKLAPASCPQ
jgi:3',5'-cyclic AMP phosphodiesterase CpdA